MSLQKVDVQHEFRMPVDRVFAYLSEHENLGVLFGLKVERVRDGDSDRNGVGSVRKLSLAGIAPFEETVTECVPDELIVYRVTKGSPIKNHEGRMEFSARESGAASHLRYRIEFESKVPGLGPVIERGLARNIAKGLRKVEQRA